MSKLAKVAIILSISITIATGIAIYYSPFHACLRLPDSDNLFCVGTPLTDDHKTPLAAAAGRLWFMGG